MPWLRFAPLQAWGPREWGRPFGSLPSHRHCIELWRNAMHQRSSGAQLGLIRL